MLIFNGSITLLIILDDDIRNKHYRKYLCCVQVLYRFISILIFLIKYYSTDFINCARHILGLLRPNLPGTVGTGLLGFFSIEFRERVSVRFCVRNNLGNMEKIDVSRLSN